MCDKLSELIVYAVFCSVIVCAVFCSVIVCAVFCSADSLLCVLFSDCLLCLCLCLQWFQSISRLHSDITKYLSLAPTSNAAVTPSSAKPTASVLPQILPSSVAATTEPSSASEIPVAVDMETEGSETTESAEMSEVNLSLETLSKESFDTSSSDTDRRNLSVVVEARSVSTSAPAVCCESNCCDNVDNAALPDDCCQASCCHSNAARTVTSHCSDFEAASVLSDMQQLVTIAAAAASCAPSTTFSAVSTASDSRSTSLNTVDCGPAVPPATSSPGFTNTSAHASSGQCRHFLH